MNFLKKIAIGYINSAKENRSTLLTPFKIVGFLGLIIGLSFGIVYPLWLFATNDKELYSSFVIILILSISGAFVLYKGIRYIYFFGIKRFLTSILLPAFFKLLRIIIVVGYIATSIFFFKENLLIAISLVIVAFIVLGYVKFVHKKS